MALLKETGAPQVMAASYAPQGQYLVGPALYPLFRMVAGIAIAAVLGAQLLAWGISVWAENGFVNTAEMLGGLLNSVPMTIGWVVIVFMILQAKGVNPKLDDEPWDPRKMPVSEDELPAKRGEQIFGIAAGSILLSLMAVMPEKIGVYNFENGEFFANPVIAQYLPWIYLSLLVGIGLNIYILWRGRKDLLSRGFELASNLLSIVVLTLLFKGHNAWLAQAGYPGVTIRLVDLSGDIMNNIQLIGMQSFRLAFGIALVVVVVETIVTIVKMVVKSLRTPKSPEFTSK